MYGGISVEKCNTEMSCYIFNISSLYLSACMQTSLHRITEKSVMMQYMEEIIHIIRQGLSNYVILVNVVEM
jgi:hypothetical protein